jgi:hypothetical protein
MPKRLSHRKKKSTTSKDKMKAKIERLKKENKALKETCEILADQKTMEAIKQSLKEIKAGKTIPLSKL